MDDEGGESLPAINSLRDATIEMLNAFVLPKDRVVYKEPNFIVEEIQRLRTCEI